MGTLLSRRKSSAIPVTREGDKIDVLTKVALGFAVLGLVGVLVSGGALLLTKFGPGAKTAAVRDDALVAAKQIAVNLQSLDFNTVEKGLDTWEASATGPLLAEFQKGRKEYAARMAQSQLTSTGRVVDVALSNLDVDKGTATAIASVDVKTTQNVNGSPSLPVTRQVRMQVELVRTPDAGWKAATASAIRP
jgi:Mce-associated membrane protein